jgi:hypothetical protein
MTGDSTTFINDLKRIPQDVKIICSDGEFMVSSVLIVARLDYARAMFNGEFKESKSKEIKLDDVLTKVAKVLFNYIQFDDSDACMEIDEAIGLYDLADKYMVEVMKKTALDILRNFAKDPETCIEVYCKCCNKDSFKAITSLAQATFTKFINKRKKMYYCPDCDCKREITAECDICGDEIIMKSPNESCKKGHKVECEYPKCSECSKDVIIRTFRLVIPQNISSEDIVDLLTTYTNDL